MGESHVSEATPFGGSQSTSKTQILPPQDQKQITHIVQSAMNSLYKNQEGVSDNLDKLKRQVEQKQVLQQAVTKTQVVNDLSKDCQAELEDQVHALMCTVGKQKSVIEQINRDIHEMAVETQEIEGEMS